MGFGRGADWGFEAAVTARLVVGWDGRGKRCARAVGEMTEFVSLWGCRINVCMRSGHECMRVVANRGAGNGPRATVQTTDQFSEWVVVYDVFYSY